MLRMKYFNNFDGDYGQFLISGNGKDYAEAYKFLSNEDINILNDSRICKFYPTPEVPSEILLNSEERRGLAQIFGFLKDKGRCHYYYDIDFFPNIEIKISKDEYENEIFEME